MEINDKEVYTLSIALTLALNEYNRRTGNKTLPTATANSLLFTFGSICTQTEISTAFLTRAEAWHRDHPDMQAQIVRELETRGHPTDNLIDLNGRRLGGR